MDKETQTPKTQFLTKIAKDVSEFEEATGVELRAISFERIDISDPGDRTKRTSIVTTELELR